MAREVLFAFVEAVEQVLTTGVDVIPTHAAFQKSAADVERLTRQVPMLAPIATLIKQLRTAPNDQQAVLVLHLAGHTRALRAALAGVGVPGTLAEIPPGPTWAFVPGHVHHVLDAIQKPDPCRIFVLANGIRSGTAFDCRLLEPTLDGLRELTGPLATMLAERVLPKYGAVILPELRARLRTAGPLESFYLLRAASRIDPQAIRAECLHYAHEPTSLAAEAIDILLKIDPPAAAAAALEQRFRWQNPVLTNGLLRAFQHTNDPRVDTLLIDALAHPKYWRTASRVLARKGLPDLLPRIEAKLLRSSVANRVWILRGLAAFNTAAAQPLLPATIAVLREQLVREQNNVAGMAAESLLQLAVPEALRVVAAQYDRPALRPLALQAMWALPADERFALLAPLVEPALTGSVGAHPEADAAFALFERPATLPRRHRTWDARWVPMFMPHLAGPRRFEVVRALRVVGVGHPEACAGLVVHLAHCSGLLAAEIAVTLGALGDPTAIPALIHTSRYGSPIARPACVRALGQLGAEEAVRAALSDPYEEVRKTALKTLVLRQPHRPTRGS